MISHSSLRPVSSANEVLVFPDRTPSQDSNRTSATNHKAVQIEHKFSVDVLELRQCNLKLKPGELGSSDPDEVIRTNSSMKSCKHIDHTPSQHPYVPLHKRISQRIAGKSPFFSLEFFPPKTTNSLARFFSQIDRLRNGNPLFVDITWHVSSDPDTKVGIYRAA
ncbi:hypothetical protein AB6A40_000464 [Gnathostoma spinigerum]|uniref:Methylenetetrahydrofolate reductase (NAD(P)H) n=1 Tax=Gnathostoma spinigerum TaxID=75299 RepID=A0ABD6EBU1_9BILA